VVTTLQGTATVTRASLSQPQPLKFRDDVFVQDRVVTVTTPSHASARRQGDRHGSRALVAHDLGIAGCLDRERRRGPAAIAVVKERMKPGETVEIRTPNAVAGIRGTS